MIVVICSGGADKPDFVSSGEATVIYLGPGLLKGSSERPNLFLHQDGFATTPCHHGLITLCVNFSPFAACAVSIVSVVLSLGFYSRSPLAMSFVLGHCCPRGVRTFLPFTSQAA